LLDVFENICQDEAEHVKTMQAFQEYAVDGSRKVLSPHSRDYDRLYREEGEKLMEDEVLTRQKWKEWGEKVNGELKP
jgi:hypothetical protein